MTTAEFLKRFESKIRSLVTDFGHGESHYIFALIPHEKASGDLTVEFHSSMTAKETYYFLMDAAKRTKEVYEQTEGKNLLDS